MDSAVGPKSALRGAMASLQVSMNPARSVRILGRALKGRRGDVVIISKVFSSTGPGPNDDGLSRSYILREIDVCLVRSFDEFTPLEEPLAPRTIRCAAVRSAMPTVATTRHGRSAGLDFFIRFYLGFIIYYMRAIFPRSISVAGCQTTSHKDTV